MKALLFALLFLPPALLAQSGLPTQSYVYVEGKAELEKSPDLVTLRFNLVTRDADQTKANQEVQTKALKIFAMLDDRKIGKNDVIAGDLRSEPQFQQEPGRPPNEGKLVGYVVTRTFAIKVRDVTAFPKLVDELMALGGVEFSGIEAGLAKEKELQDDIWSKALDDARTRAEKTLKPLSMKIDSVFAVSPVSFPEISQHIFGSNQTYQAFGAAPAERTIDAGASQYRLPPVTIRQSVHVIYLISPAK
ncbi:MAG: SIMPL domain-containing protein [Verrucomicrobiota bacterium]|nr:SIMPL domain-containing protein [Verrucomicrobiota bacterium]